ncbi:MAG TPA: NADH-quinone oxidoreductase subunit J [Bryobacteraceae bacterium]|nr:NADH-quinone oxidoreductase subunit J [Bryobacteraceae bacterium]
MEAAFYVSSAVAIAATLLTITRANAIHALLYLIVSLLAVAVVFFTLGAPFVAALEVIIYAGAIMVLFIFVVMMLNLGERATAIERRLQTPQIWIGPAILASLLLAEIIDLMVRGAGVQNAGGAVTPKQVAIVLFSGYLIGVELASMLLLAGMVAAYHLGVRKRKQAEVQDAEHTREGRVSVGRDFVHAGPGGRDGPA